MFRSGIIPKIRSGLIALSHCPQESTCRKAIVEWSYGKTAELWLGRRGEDAKAFREHGATVAR